MMKHHPAIEYIGRLVTERCRDRSIRDHDVRVTAALKRESYKYKSFIESLTLDQRNDLRRMIIETVDGTLHNIMLMFEEYPDIHIAIDLEDQSISDLRKVAAGDLQGYPGIWAEEFSTQPLSHEP